MRGYLLESIVQVDFDIQAILEQRVRRLRMLVRWTQEGLQKFSVPLHLWNELRGDKHICVWPVEGLLHAGED